MQYQINNSFRKREKQMRKFNGLMNIDLYPGYEIKKKY